MVNCIKYKMANYKKYKNKKGFTLIEVMVSASILALLAAIIFGNVNQSRVKAAEVKAIQEAKSLQTATELYRSDNGQYPASKGTKDDLSNLETALVPKYIPEIPTGPDIAEYSDFCPNIPKIRYISNGSVAEDDNYQYRCGPGTKADSAVVLILSKDQDIPDENKAYAKLKSSSNQFGVFELIQTMQLASCAQGATCDPGFACSQYASVPGVFLFDNTGNYPYICFSI